MKREKTGVNQDWFASIKKSQIIDEIWHVCEHRLKYGNEAKKKELNHSLNGIYSTLIIDVPCYKILTHFFFSCLLFASIESARLLLFKLTWFPLTWNYFSQSHPLRVDVIIWVKSNICFCVWFLLHENNKERTWNERIKNKIKHSMFLAKWYGKKQTESSATERRF